MNWGLSVSFREETFKLTLKEYLQHYGSDAPEAPQAPEEVAYIWGYWNRIRARTGGGDGVSPITFEAIESFARLTGEIVSRDDVVMLEALDNAFISEVSIQRTEMMERQRQEAANK